MKLYEFQSEALERNKGNKVAFYHDMGLGKTFTGAEKLHRLNAKNNLVVCQKSKIDDWSEHFRTNYQYEVFDLTKGKSLKEFIFECSDGIKPVVGVINYELLFRRTELTELSGFTLLLDESSLIQNEGAKRSNFILKKLHPENIILLSGTPCNGKYENLWSQLYLLGWKMSKDLFWKQYVDFHYDTSSGFPIKVIDGYKNVERLKNKMREYGCDFLKTNEVYDLPEQIEIVQGVQASKEYKTFKKKRIVSVDKKELVGDTTLTKMLFERMLCGQYSDNKLEALQNILEGTEDRVIIFYNFNEELYKIEDICLKLNKPVSIVNGHEKDLLAFNEHENSVTIIQYQAGAMGLNLQLANKIVYFTPPLSSELYEQSKKRTHRIGQKKELLLLEDDLQRFY